MTTELVRLLDQADLPEAERLLLDAGRAVRPVDYDVAAGEARFRRNLAALAAAGVVAGAAGQGMRASGKMLLGKLAVKVLVGVTLAAAFSGVGVVAGMRIAKEQARSTAPVAATAPAHPHLAPVIAPAAAPSAVPAAPVAPTAEAPSSEVAVHAAPAHGAPEVATHTPRIHVASGLVAPSKDATREAPGEGPREAWPESSSDVRLRSAEVTRPAPAREPAATAAPVPQEPPPPAPSAAPPAATPTTTVAQTPAPASSSISEIRAVAMARSLVDRDPEAALDLLAKAQRAYPTGYFLEERQALTVIALARAGRSAEARQAAASFLRAYPNGPYSDRVRAVTAP